LVGRKRHGGNGSGALTRRCRGGGPWGGGKSFDAASATRIDEDSNSGVRNPANPPRAPQYNCGFPVCYGGPPYRAARENLYHPSTGFRQSNRPSRIPGRKVANGVGQSCANCSPLGASPHFIGDNLR
jgi:hypothetical protein